VGDWIERNKAHIIVLLLSLMLNGGLVLLLNRPPSGDIEIVSPTATSVQTTVQVFVSGAVLAPDVYELPVGSLVRDAVMAAGGGAEEADLDQLNLARGVKDHEQIFVPRRPEGSRSGIIRLPDMDLTSGNINLNTATEAELDSLPGIGPSLAKSIIEYRANKGSFASVEGIKEVHGVGDKIYEQVKDWLIVS
jgi:competence protein ComEA